MRSARYPAFILAAGFLLLASGRPFMPRAVAAANPLDPLVARGQGFEITESQLEEAFIQLRSTLAARGQDLPATQRTEAQALLLDRVIVVKILVGRATADELAQADQAAQKSYDAILTAAGSEQAFLRQLTALGSTPEKFKNRLREQAIVDAALERDLFGKVAIGKSAVQKYYADHPQQFERPELARVQHIFVAGRDRVSGRELTEEQRKAKKAAADKALARAQKGEDFAALVREYSDDPASRDQGGFYTLARSADKAAAVMPEFEAAAFALSTNQISGLVTTKFGHHIVKLIEKQPARKQPLAEAEPDIVKFLQRQEGQKQLPAYVERLRKEAKAEILSKELRDYPRPVDKSVPLTQP
jgi:parvulin-like peptidyl-prolyl isomerase